MLHRSNRPRKGDQGRKGKQLCGDRENEGTVTRAHQRAAASMDLLLPARSGLHAENTRAVTSSCVVVG